MCMATLIPAGVEIPYTGLANGAVTNKDGHGFAIASHLGIEIFKSMVYKETEDALKEARERHGKDSIVLFHSRWGTHGEYGEFNVHPFIVEADDEGNILTVMAHNGVLPVRYHPEKEKTAPGKMVAGKWEKGEVIEPGDRRSDTRIFVDEETMTYCDNARGVPTRSGGRALGKLIGGGNKLIFLSVRGGTPKARIINSHMGDFVQGVWFSNSGYKYGCGGTRGRFSSSSPRTNTTSASTPGTRMGYSSHEWWDQDEEIYSVGEQAAATASRISEETSMFAESSAGQEDGALARCPSCLGMSVDTVINLCGVCDWCLDCDMKFEDCMCFYAGASENKKDDRDGAIQDKLYEAWCNKEISDDDYVRGFRTIYPDHLSVVQEQPESKVDPAEATTETIPIIQDTGDNGMVKVDDSWVNVNTLIGG